LIVRFLVLKIIILLWLLFPLLTRAASISPAPSSPTASVGGPTPLSSTKPSAGNLLNFQAMQRTALVNEIKQNALSQSEVVWLNQPVIRKFPATKFLGLTEADRAPANQGAVLIQPDIGQSADWPNIIKPLRQSLPDAGWFTLAISPPYGSPPVFFNQVPPTKPVTTQVSVSAGVKAQATSKSSGNTSSATVKPAVKVKNTVVDISSKNKIKKDASSLVQPPWQDEMKARITAAMGYLRNKGFQNTVIIGVGRGAQGVVDYVKAQSGRLPAKGLAVILINAKLDKKDLIGFDTDFGKGFSFPILDIYSTGNPLSIKEAKIRKRAALRGRFKRYLSLGLLIENTRFIHDSVFEKRIRDWLKVYAPGVKTKI